MAYHTGAALPYPNQERFPTDQKPVFSQQQPPPPLWAQRPHTGQSSEPLSPMPGAGYPGAFQPMDYTEQPPGPRCKTGFFKRFPWLGLAAWTGSILCTIAAGAILFLSNGQPVAEWSGNRQPQVLLAYTSTIANSLVGVAFAQAVIIAYWRRALRGTTLPDLHYHWESGHGAPDALKAVLKGKVVLVALACLAVTISSLLRGPMIQRSTHVEGRTVVVSNEMLDVNVAATVDDSFGGILTNGLSGEMSCVWNPGMIATARAYQNRETIQLNSTTCDNCTLSIPALGFTVNCTTTMLPFSLDLNDPSFQENQESNMDVFNSTVFASDTIATGVQVAVVRKSSPDCAGNMEQKVCDLSPALVSYAASLDGSTVTLLSSTWQNDTVIRPITLANLTFPVSNSTVAQSKETLVYPMVMWGKGSYTSEMYTRHVQGWDLETDTGTDSGGSTLSSFMMHLPDGQPNCTVWFSDPMDDIINSYRELAFRASVQAAADNGTGSMQSLPYVASTQTLVYAVDWSSLAVAVVISLLGPLAVLPLFWGWWSLPRQVSMSPLGIANSFSSGRAGGGAGVLFDACTGNEEGDELAKMMGRNERATRVRVCYGILPGSNRLGMGLESAVGGLMRVK